MTAQYTSLGLDPDPTRRAVLQAVSQGWTAARIAPLLGVSVDCVEAMIEDKGEEPMSDTELTREKVLQAAFDAAVETHHASALIELARELARPDGK